MSRIGKACLCLLLLASLTMSTGCWNRRELNSLAIAVGMGIDVHGEEYELSIQVVNPTALDKKASTGRSEAVQYRSHRPTIFEALRKMTTESPRKVYLSHLRILVLSEAAARKGIDEIIDFISRDHEARTDFLVVVARDVSASEVLNVYSRINAIPAISLFDMLRLSETAWAATSTVQLDDLLKSLDNDSGNSGVITGVRLTGNAKIAESKENVERIRVPGKLTYGGLAVYKKGRLVGWLSEDHSASYNFIAGKVKNTVLRVPCPDGGNIVLEVHRAQSSIKPLLQGDSVGVSVKQTIRANVGEVACGAVLTDADTIDKLESAAASKIREQLGATIAYVQKTYGADIFEFGQAIHRSHPRAWQKLRPDWEHEFVKLQAKVEVDLKIRRIGTVNNSTLEESEE